MSQQEAGAWQLVDSRPTEASSPIQMSGRRSSHSHRPGSEKDAEKVTRPWEVIYTGTQAEKDQRGTQKWAELGLGHENRAEAQSFYLR